MLSANGSLTEEGYIVAFSSHVAVALCVLLAIAIAYIVYIRRREDAAEVRFQAELAKSNALSTLDNLCYKRHNNLSLPSPCLSR